MAEAEAGSPSPSAPEVAEVVVLAIEEDAIPTKPTEAPEEEQETVVESSEPSEIPVASSDHKRKLEDPEPREDGEEAPEKKQEVSSEEAPEVPDDPRSDGLQDPISAVQEIAVQISSPTAGPTDAKRPRLDGEADGLAADGGHSDPKLETTPPVENNQHTSTENIQHIPAVNLQPDSLPSAGQQPSFELPTSSRKMEIPNNKVGVLIGKAGDTIKFLQYNSGAKIQITRDTEADPYSSTRPVELIGTLENINKAEQLIKDVIAEADAGGSPALVARGFGTIQSGGEQLEIQVPNEKVGMIIGKGGETIKNLQTRSGARIQLIPQHLPEGDASRERTVRVTGSKKQIDSAREMIKEVTSQTPGRPSHSSSGHSQQTFRPRGPTTQPQWGPRAPPATQQTMGYDYQQRGTYPPQTTQYPPQAYAGYSQQAPPRSGFSTGWDQRSVAPVQTAPQTGGYDYYGQGGQATDTQSSNPVPAPSSAPVNYNYGQSQAPGYGQQAPYAQSVPTQQSYGHGYEEPKYDNQAPTQQIYGQQHVSSQPGVYQQQVSAPQSGYTQQQPYSKPTYGGPAQGAPQSYAQPRPSQQGDPMYQGHVPSSYGSGGPTQQSYPYGSSAPSQQTPGYGQTYGPSSGTADGYNQQPSAGYAQQGGQAAPAYGQGTAYAQQSTQTGGYGQYPSSQPSYNEQPVPNNVNYGYQGGSADAGYGSSLPSSGYGAPQQVSSQAGYVQPMANPSGYEQSVPPQSGYGSIPGGQVGYTKGLSPQPGYGGLYDSAQMYGHH